MNMTVGQRSTWTLPFLHQSVRAEADGAAHGSIRHSVCGPAMCGTAGPQGSEAQQGRRRRTVGQRSTRTLPFPGGVLGTVLGAQQLQRRLERPPDPATFAITKKFLP